MAYYDALIAAWNATGKPAGVSGTDLAAGMTAQQKLDAINGWTVAGANVRVSRGDVRQHFDNLVDTNDVPVWEHIEANNTGAGALNIACRAALRLRDAPGDYPAVDLTAPLFQGQVNALVAGALMTQAQANGLFALGATTMPWWKASGYSQPIGTADLTLAGGLS